MEFQIQVERQYSGIKMQAVEYNLTLLNMIEDGENICVNMTPSSPRFFVDIWAIILNFSFYLFDIF